MPDAFPASILKQKVQDPVTRAPRVSRTTDVNALIKVLKTLKKVSVKLVAVDGGAETTINVLAFDDAVPLEGGGSGGGTPATVYPFDMTVTPNGGNVDVTFNPGSCGSIIPSNIFSTFSLANPGTHYSYLEAAAGAGGISSCTIAFYTSAQADSPVTENAPPSTFRIPLGLVLDGIGYNLLKKNAVPYATVRFQVDRPPPIQPGEPAWDYFYAWRW